MSLLVSTSPRRSPRLPQADHPQPTWGAPVRLVLVAPLLLLLLLPVDFVVLRSPWGTISYAALGAGVLAAVGSLLGRGRLGSLRWLLLPMVLVAGPVVLARGLPGALVFVAVLVTGIGVGLWFRWSPSTLVGLLFLTTVVLGLETLTSRHLYGDLLGQQRFVSFGDLGFRPRGIFGQPVPAAAVAALLFIAAWWSASSSRPGRRRLLRGTALACLVVTLLLTGTRSALVVLLAMGLLQGVQGLRQAPRPQPRAVIGVLVLAVASLAAAFLRLGFALPQARLFAFWELRGSISLLNRLGFVDIFRSLGTEDSISQLLGHGIRALQLERRRYSGLFGLSTADNQYATSAWDSGWLGLAALAVLLVLAAVLAYRTARDRRDPVRTAASSVLLAGLLFGFFFDVLYVRSCLLVIGVALGTLMASPEAAPPSAGEGEER